MGYEMDGEARELELYAENDEPIYRHEQAVRKNLAKKMLKGKYDSKLAEKAFLYTADMASKKYRKEFGGSGRGAHAFTVAQRKAVAQRMEESFRADLASGDVELSELAGLKPRASRRKTR